MALYKYSTTFDPAKSAPAQAFDVNASYKDMYGVMRAINGLPVAKADKLLDDAISMTRAIRFRRHETGMGHRSELGGKKGKYPVKEARLVKQLLANAVASANARGLEPKNLVVLHAAAYKQNTFPRYRRFFVGGNTLGYGKHAVMSKYMTCRVDLVVGEKGLKPLPKKTKAQLAVERKTEKSKPKAEAKPAAKPAAKAEAKHEHAHEHAHDHEHKHDAAKPAAKPEAKAEAKAEVKSEGKV